MLEVRVIESVCGYDQCRCFVIPCTDYIIIPVDLLIMPLTTNRGHGVRLVKAIRDLTRNAGEKTWISPPLLFKAFNTNGHSLFCRVLSGQATK